MHVQSLGQADTGSGRINVSQRIDGDLLLFQEKIKKGSQSRQPAGIAAGAYFPPVAGLKIFPDVFTADGFGVADVPAGKKIEKKSQIRAVRIDSILRQPFFGNQVVEKKIEKGLEVLSAQGSCPVRGCRKPKNKACRLEPAGLMLYILFFKRLNLRSFLRASALLRRFLTLGFS